MFALGRVVWFVKQGHWLAIRASASTMVFAVDRADHDARDASWRRDTQSGGSGWRQRIVRDI